MSRQRFCLFLMVLSLAFNGCGEAFRAPHDDQDSSFDSLASFEQLQRDFSQETEIERLILQTYADELRGRELQTRRLGSSIRAFDLALRVDDPETGDMTLGARIVFNCLTHLDFIGRVNVQQLSSGNRINLGRVENYGVRVQCTTRSCKNAVVAVSRLDNNNEATVLVPMSMDQTREDTISFIGRNLELEPFYMAYRSSRYYGALNSCPFDDGVVDGDGDGDRDFNDLILSLLDGNIVEVGEDILLGEAQDILDDITGSLGFSLDVGGLVNLLD